MKNPADPARGRTEQDTGPAEKSLRSHAEEGSNHPDKA